MSYSLIIVFDSRKSQPDLLDIVHGLTLGLVSILATRMTFNLKDQGVMKNIRRDVTPLNNVSIHARGPSMRVI